MVECARVLLICAHVMSWARSELDVLGRRLDVSAHVDVVEASDLRLLARLLIIAVRRRGHFAALHLCIDYKK